MRVNFGPINTAPILGGHSNLTKSVFRLQNNQGDVFFRSKPKKEVEENASAGITCSITPEMLILAEKWGKKFAESVGENPTHEQFEKVYYKYRSQILSVLTKDRKDVTVLRHSWMHIVDTSLIRLSDSLAKAGRRDDTNKGVAKKKVENVVEKTNFLFRTHCELFKNAKPTNRVLPVFSAEDTFNVALKLLRDNDKNIEINVTGIEELRKSYQGSGQFDNFIIYTNVIGNAIKYSPENSTINVIITEENDEYIYKDGRHSGDFNRHYYITVEDEGIGIPPEEQEAILGGNVRGSNVGDIEGTGQGMLDVCSACGRKKPEITSPLYPDEPIYKGTRVKVKLDCTENTWGY